MRPTGFAPARLRDLPIGPLRFRRAPRVPLSAPDPRRASGGYREHCPHCGTTTQGVLRCLRCGKVRP